MEQKIKELQDGIGEYRRQLREGKIDNREYEKVISSMRFEMGNLKRKIHEQIKIFFKFRVLECMEEHYLDFIKSLVSEETPPLKD